VEIWAPVSLVHQAEWPQIAGRINSNLQVLLGQEATDLFMQTFIERFVKGESGVTAYGLTAAALMLIGVGAWVIATAPRVVASPQINPLEMMANAKDLPSSLATTKISPAAVAQPRTAPAASEPKSQTGPWSQMAPSTTKRFICQQTAPISISSWGRFLRLAFPNLTKGRADNSPEKLGQFISFGHCASTRFDGLNGSELTCRRYRSTFSFGSKTKSIESRDLRALCCLAPGAYRVHFFCPNVGTRLFSARRGVNVTSNR